MSTVIESLERAQLRRVPQFQAGDRVRVHFQVIEGTRRRTQVFEGIVIKRQGQGARETFTVRKQSFGVGVERTFPVHSPKIEKIEVASRGDVRRAKLYYLRGRVGRRARVRERQYTGPTPISEVEPMEALDAQGAQDEAVVLPPEEAPAEDQATETAAEAPAAEEASATEEPAADEAPAEDQATEAPAAEADTADAPASEEEPAAEADADPDDSGAEEKSDA